jgi:hypothetical protein
MHVGARFTLRVPNTVLKNLVKSILVSLILLAPSDFPALQRFLARVKYLDFF